MTVGDEFQGAYTTLGAAVEAALHLRLLLLPAVDTRIGLGRGAVTILDRERGIEDGPAWWAARAAIEEVEQAAGRPATRHLRTAYRVSAEGPRGARLRAPRSRPPSTRRCCVGTIWLAPSRTGRSDC